jgi:hypothetical protein
MRYTGILLQFQSAKGYELPGLWHEGFRKSRRRVLDYSDDGYVGAVNEICDSDVLRAIKEGGGILYRVGLVL